jgi:predicted methyltransferase
MKHLKTELGQQAFKERSSLLSARQRSAFIMFDGLKTTEQILQAVTGLGVTQADIDYLVLQGFLTPVVAAAVAAPGPVGSVVASGSSGDPSWEPDSEIARDVERIGLLSRQERYAMACTVATQLTSSLGLRGFRLNLAVQGAGDFDDLVTLLPKIQDAVGPKACRQLARLLKV